MSAKIKISKRVPEISDDEIHQFQDFEKLMEAHKKLQRRKRRTTTWWWISGALFLAIVALTIVMTNQQPEQKFQLPSKQQESQVVTENQSTTADDIAPRQNTIRDSLSIAPKSRSVKKVVEGEAQVVTIDSSAGKMSSKATFEQVYRKAEPVDGYPNLYAYFERELVYPVEMAPDSIEGTILVIFVIDATGKTGSITFKNSLGAPFEREALKLMQNMPLWKPATVNDVPISSTLSLPIKFKAPAKPATPD